MKKLLTLLIAFSLVLPSFASAQVGQFIPFFRFTNATGTSATTTSFFTTTASTTNFFGAGLSLCQSGNVLTYNGAGKFGCAADATGGASAYDAWTHPSVGVSASTSQFIFNNASSTFTGNLNITGNSTTTNATTTNFFATTASSTNIYGGALSTCSEILRWSAGKFSCALVSSLSISASQIAGTLGVPSGGTGQSSFTANNLLVGDGSNALRNVATTSLSVGSGISSSATLGALVGGSNSTLTVDQSFSPTWTGAHIFNNITRSTTTQATSTNLFATTGTFTNFFGASLTSCANANSALTWTGGQFGCNSISGGSGGTDVNWSFFNTSGIKPATTTNQVLIGAAATTSLANLEVRFQTAAAGSILATGSTTLQNFTFLNATGTSATTTNFFTTTASSTNEFFLNSNGTNLTTKSLTISPLASALLQVNGSGVVGTYLGAICSAGNFLRNLTASGSALCDNVLNLASATTTIQYGPISANPTIQTAVGGHWSFDSTAASSSIRWSDGSVEKAVYDTQDRSFTFASSTLSYMGQGYGASGTTTIFSVLNPYRPVTLVSFYCKTDTGTAHMAFGTGSATTTDANCSSTGTRVNPSSNNTWVMAQDVKLDIGRTSGTPGMITVTATFRTTAD